MKKLQLSPEFFSFASGVVAPSGKDEESHFILSEEMDFLEFSTAGECRAYIEGRLKSFESCGLVDFKDSKDAKIYVRDDEFDREGFFELVWAHPEAYQIFSLFAAGCSAEDAIAEFEADGFVRE